jgi:hypothetical protein
MTLLARVVDFLERDGWGPALEEGFIESRFRGDNGEWPVYVTVIEEQHRIVAYSVYTVRVPPERRPDVAELFVRINFHLLVGSFDLDLDDGEARFRTSLDVEGGKLTDGLLQQVLYANVTAMDEYLPALEGVVAEGLAVADALARID